MGVAKNKGNWHTLTWVAKNKGRVIGSFCLRGSQKLWLGLLLKVFPCEIQFLILGREVAVSSNAQLLTQSSEEHEESGKH